MEMLQQYCTLIPERDNMTKVIEPEMSDRSSTSARAHAQAAGRHGRDETRELAPSGHLSAGPGNRIYMGLPAFLIIAVFALALLHGVLWSADRRRRAIEMAIERVREEMRRIHGRRSEDTRQS